ncbi:MAG: type I-B CRISPR-associated protein Cas5b [Bacteroidota bacterium]|nr:type I-B CRISPR-associated protein Cas5b [Candidatus Kapabacteria bacterium]MDW8221245.1 type I-B CRISPR-associated protein Cas5b [Bacteroidota bacterium]
MNNKALVFDIFGDYAHFRRYYTTMSPLTFSVPPGTALRGMLGAILGIDREVAPEHFHDVELSLRILNPIKKVTIPINYIQVESSSHFSRYPAHKPTNIEFVKDPTYRVYVRTSNTTTYTTLHEKLSRHESVYTLSFGISEALANFTFVGEFDIQPIDTGTLGIDSMIPIEYVHALPSTGDLQCFTEKLPMKMLNNREVIEYREFLFERTGTRLLLNIPQGVQLSNGERIVFF